MGNVNASSQNQSGNMPAPPPPNLSSTKIPDISVDHVEPATDSNHPGTMEELHKKCRDVFPGVFEGAKFIVNKGLSHHFQISHTLNMGTLMPSGYRFGATYVGEDLVSASEAYPILLGDIDPSGNLNANVIHQYKKFRGKFVTQIQDSKCVASQATVDYRGHDFSASTTLGNLDLLNGTGVAVFHYLQSVTPSLDLGAEMVCHSGAHFPGGEMSLVSLAGRYSGEKSVISATVGLAGAHACYYYKESENLQIGVEVDTNLRSGDSVCQIGYQVDLPRANLVFRGMVDSNWTVGAVLEKKLMPLPFTFSLSGMLNHQKNQCRVGCGFFIG